MLSLLSAFFILQPAITQNVGEECRYKHTNTIGRCALADQCLTAKDDYQLNGILPTYCSRELFNGIPLICCRDSNTFQQTVHNENHMRHGSSDKRRVSERKCEEYSKSVVQMVEFFPLLLDPEQGTISAPKCNYTGVELIVGGEDAIQGEFPHMAAIGWVDNEEKYAFYCGGSLISSRFVLTAAHCTYDPHLQHSVPSIVRLGEQNLDLSVHDGATPIDVPIKAIHKHPAYAPPSKYNDIALFELLTDVHFSNDIRPACLWNKPDFNGHIRALATGWGVRKARYKKNSDDLQKVSLTLLDNNSCNKLLEKQEKRLWKKGVIPTQMCVGEPQGEKDTCQGDSGSPLQVASSENQCIFHVVGLTSFGVSCAQPGKPAIYTRVSEYLDWIESIVWPGE